MSKFDYDSPMSRERFNFAHINSGANATSGIDHINVPFLGLFGEDDQNVDVQNSYKIYKEIFDQRGKADYKLIIFQKPAIVF